MLTSKTGATMETDLEETTAGWVARYLIVSKGFGRMGPIEQRFRKKPDAVAWLMEEATADGFVDELPA